MFLNELLKSDVSFLRGALHFFLLCSLTHRDSSIHRTLTNRNYSKMTADSCGLAGNHAQRKKSENSINLVNKRLGKQTNKQTNW